MSNLLTPQTFHKRIKLFIREFDFEETIVPKSKQHLFFKRVFDITVSFLVIVLVLSWLIPILAILIKLDSRGPVFFVQKRVGAFGKNFNCYKLRTMYTNSQSNTQQAQVNDPRITSFGKFLRLSCLDELPQFFNVLIGNMSIVGPRPHMLKDCHEFSKIVREYKTRELVKPGITGIAQVKGYRGKTDTVYDVVHRYKWDIFYVKNYNFHLDMRIMRLTITSTITAVFATLKNQRAKGREMPRLNTPEYLN
jgi:putative colanic acid biosynthesis UDP-glucose lipid carrier transferase